MPEVEALGGVHMVISLQFHDLGNGDLDHGLGR